MQTTRKHPAGGKPAMTMIAASLLAAALCTSLSACGGSTPPRALNVVAATGKAVASSVVTVQDASKNVVGSGTTDANGKVAVTLLESAVAPFLVSVTAPSGATLYSVTLKENAVNLTPLTSVIAMQLLGNAPASATAAQLAAIDANKLATVQGQLGAALATSLQAKGLSAGYDFVNGTLAPGSSDPADALLDAVQVKVSGADIDIVNTSGSILAQMTGGSVPVATGNSINEPALNLSARQQALIATAAGTDAAPALLQVGLDELHPTQPAVGYDQIYYKLGRYGAEDLVMAKTNKPKKFADLCEANGQSDVVSKTSNVAGATLVNPPAAFQCKSPVGASPVDMKTVVIGPKGKLYLTDGHHTFTSFWDADGGANHQLKVWVKVTANLSNLNEYDFWSLMKKTSKVWLKDGNNQPIVTSQLPRQIGLSSLGNDPYRSLVYYTRDAGYIVPAASTEFLEFYWADWLRNKPVLDLSTYNLGDAASYSAAILKASQAMVALKPTDVVSTGMTAATLGWSGVLNTAALDDLVTSTGKLTYAIAYQKSIGK